MIRKRNTLKKLPKQIKLQMDTTKSHPGEGGGGMGLQHEKDRKAIVLLGYLGLTLVFMAESQNFNPSKYCSGSCKTKYLTNIQDMQTECCKLH